MSVSIEDLRHRSPALRTLENNPGMLVLGVSSHKDKLNILHPQLLTRAEQKPNPLGFFDGLKQSVFESFRSKRIESDHRAAVTIRELRDGSGGLWILYCKKGNIDDLIRQRELAESRF